MKKSLIAFAATLSLASAHAEVEPGVISLSASSQTQVENDQIQAELFYEIQSKDPDGITSKLNQAASRALAKAAPYKNQVVVQSNLRTYPVYGEKSTITGWRGRSTLTIKSTDLQQANQLISDMLSPYLINRINYSVSDDLLQETQNQLIAQTTQNFKDRALSIAQGFGSSGYKIKEVNLSFSQPGRPIPVMYAARSMDSSEAASAKSMQSGESAVSVNANGSVTLNP